MYQTRQWIYTLRFFLHVNVLLVSENAMKFLIMSCHLKNVIYLQIIAKMKKGENVNEDEVDE